MSQSVSRYVDGYLVYANWQPKSIPLFIFIFLHFATTLWGGGGINVNFSWLVVLRSRGQFISRMDASPAPTMGDRGGTARFNFTCECTI